MLVTGGKYIRWRVCAAIRCLPVAIAGFGIGNAGRKTSLTIRVGRSLKVNGYFAGILTSQPFKKLVEKYDFKKHNMYPVKK